MRQGVQSTRPQKEAWSGQQLQLDLRSMRPVLQQNEHPSTPSCPVWETRGQAETYRWRDQQHLNQDPAQSRAVPCYHPELPWGIMLDQTCCQRTQRPERCIDNIGSPSVQRRRPATLSKSGTTLHSMRWQRPPFQRWYGTCTDSRPQPSRSTCLLVLS